METKTLEILKGTDYQVSVELDELGDYQVELTRPSTEKGNRKSQDELIGIRYLKVGSTKKDLTRVVKELMATDVPSLAGKYKGEEDANE